MEAPTTKPEGVDALAPDWSEEDKQWLAKQPTAYQHIAVRYGKLTYQLVMCSGTISFALGQIAPFASNQRVNKALGNLLVLTNQLLTVALQGHNVDMVKFKECKNDIETLGALMNIQAGQEVTPSGLIIKPH